MTKWLLLLLLLVSCGKSSPPPKTVEQVYAEAVQLYGVPEQVEKVYQPQCEYTIWYSASVGAMVREEKRSSYGDKGFNPGAYNPGQNTQIQLISYTRR